MAPATSLPYPSPGSGLPMGIHRSIHSLPQHLSTLQLERPLPALLGSHTNGFSAASIPRASNGSKVVFEATASNMFNQPQPIASSYGTFIDDMHSVEQNTIGMPDNNEITRLFMGHSNRQEASSLPRLDTWSPPYPMYDEDWSTDLPGEVFHSAHSGPSRHPTIEDFSRSEHPLPPPPLEEYDSGQDLSIIEPDSWLPDGWHEQHDDAAAAGRNPATQENTGQPQRCSGEPSTTSYRVHGLDLHNERPQSELMPPSHVNSNAPADTDDADVPVHVQTINSDMYQPTLGGLHRVSSVPCKDSRRDHVKHFLGTLNPFRQKRIFGRAQRR